MSFIWPVMLFSLLLIPLLVLLYWQLVRSRAHAAEKYGGFGLLKAGAAPGVGRRSHVPPAFFLASLSILLVALARPQAVVSVPRVEGTVILAFDVSGSMAAEDMSPSRMEAAKAAARSFVQRQPPSVKIGIVAFSDGGLAVQPPTNDPLAIQDTINRLEPQRGTSLASGIMAALKVIDAASKPSGAEPRLYSNAEPQPTPSPTPFPQGTYTNASIILLTDGENNMRPDPTEAAQAAAAQGVRIYTVGIGSPGGYLLHINGFTVQTKLDEPALQQISNLTGGAYFNAQNEQELASIYDHLNPQLVVKPESTEVTSLFAAAGVLVMLLGSLFSFLWFGRMP